MQIAATVADPGRGGRGTAISGGGVDGGMLNRRAAGSSAATETLPAYRTLFGASGMERADNCAA